ncbi:bifunctional hydroxymethylpyrimidine kinase/phosphomethylpyrimidine kinase [Streptococcus oricebi]|uniref:pyridoxal kinase n=1 Tax=Streptococcus oricebi TaxID=1547447 RepID=A0ABS5B5F7_9STRE|nr:bifunctional hydroxymethylpyrimidine kinase/phosphomethylpyrimidine kinase [Streptococcus oricebi]MBP2624044.1 hydroxymethylpyrimidine/phosphomethylpyrimidine kinase [Streptococcus oricebi]
MRDEMILAISGNDIFSGGGLYADLTTYTSMGQRGFVAVTCLTAMTQDGFEVKAVAAPTFAQELASLEEVPFSVIKIGLLPNPEIADLALDFVRERAELPLVLDPVLVCKESHDVEVSALRRELIKFFPYASIITPNLAEAQILADREIKNLADMKEAAQELHALGAQAVVIKGGSRFDPEKAIDVFYDGQTLEVLESPLLDSNNVGAGCTFASSIASHLAKGENLLLAVKAAKAFVYRAIQDSDEYGVVQYERKNNQ